MDKVEKARITVEATIDKYRVLSERYERDGKTLLMESTDASKHILYKQFLADLNNIRVTLI